MIDSPIFIPQQRRHSPITMLAIFARQSYHPFSQRSFFRLYRCRTLVR
jgi:hypothetical protein